MPQRFTQETASQNPDHRADSGTFDLQGVTLVTDGLVQVIDQLLNGQGRHRKQGGAIEGSDVLRSSPGYLVSLKAREGIPGSRHLCAGSIAATLFRLPPARKPTGTLVVCAVLMIRGDHAKHTAAGLISPATLQCERNNLSPVFRNRWSQRRFKEHNAGKHATSCQLFNCYK
ncbi:hypothetical protein Bbelb_191900 [Branchiostoma belcheri]|nr:hypothetical protein Bbelb_191900 [Branchiostoma belcheri]